jgi:hypothetical protein
MSARTDALVPRAETGKIVSRVHLPRCGRLSPGGAAVNARLGLKFSGRHFPTGIGTRLASRHTALFPKAKSSTEVLRLRPGIEALQSKVLARIAQVTCLGPGTSLRDFALVLR